MNAESKINIHYSSLVGLKAELLRKQAEVDEAKSKIQNSLPIGKPKSKEKIFEEKQKKAKDEKNEMIDQIDDIESIKALQKSKIMLQAKSRLYEKLSKSHVNMNPNFLVDFEHKFNDSEQLREKIQNSDSASEIYSDSDDEWVEYTDCFGRTRKCLREDLPEMQKKDEILKKDVRVKSPKQENEKVLFVEDRIPEKETEIAMMRKKWEEETAKLAHKVDIHYQDVLFDEARTHGVGYFAFSQDEDKRIKQQESLSKLRKETEQKQKENQEVREMKEKMQQNRLKVARMRQRIRAGLPIEDVQETVDSNSIDSSRIDNKETQVTEIDDKKVDNTRQELKNEVSKRKLENEQEKIECHKLLNKKVKWYKMSQEEWTEVKRDERIDEFAPIYKNSENSELSNSTYNTNQNLRTLNENEDSNSYDVIGPLPSQYENEPEINKETLFSDSPDCVKTNIAEQIEAGLKYLRKQFESKNR